jgi:hypothetical protein
VVKRGRYPYPSNALDDITGSPGSIRQEDDALTRFDQTAKTFESSRERGDAVVNDPPEIENEPVVAGGQPSDAGSQPNRHDAPQTK